MIDHEYVERLHKRISDLETDHKAATEENIWLRERLRSIGELANVGMEPPPRVNRMKVAQDRGYVQVGGKKRQLAEGEMLSAAAAKYIGKSRGFLDQDRRREIPRIPFDKRGRKTIVYRKEDLDSFLENETKPPSIYGDVGDGD